MKQNPVRFTIGLIVPLVFLSCGLTFVGIGVSNSWQAWRSQDWRTTTGTIMSSEVNYYTDSDGDTTYEALVSYSYLPDHPDYVGQTLTSDRIKFGAVASSNDTAAEETVARYPVGQDVTVYLNPNDPTDAVLEPGLSLSLLFFLLMGLTFTGIGSIFAYGVVKSFRRT